MSDADFDRLIEKAESLYASRLQPMLERNHPHEFVSIEPESGEYFLGKSLSEAIASARRAYTDRLVHTMRVGHKAAVHVL